MCPDPSQPGVGHLRNRESGVKARPEFWASSLIWTHLSSCELGVIIPRMFLSASWQLDSLGGNRALVT